MKKNSIEKKRMNEMDPRSEYSKKLKNTKKKLFSSDFFWNEIVKDRKVYNGSCRVLVVV